MKGYGTGIDTDETVQYLKGTDNATSLPYYHINFVMNSHVFRILGNSKLMLTSQWLVSLRIPLKNESVQYGTFLSITDTSTRYRYLLQQYPTLHRKQTPLKLLVCNWGKIMVHNSDAAVQTDMMDYLLKCNSNYKQY